MGYLVLITVGPACACSRERPTHCDMYTQKVVNDIGRDKNFGQNIPVVFLDERKYVVSFNLYNLILYIAASKLLK